MLTQLCMQNFAIIPELNLEFEIGMTVLTGETGAGKSIMIDALELCLGSRADSNVVGSAAKSCDLSASFDITAIPQAQTWLKHHDLSCDTECILRRTLSQDGRSASYINGHRSPLQQTRELAELLVNIHGQHENQALLKREHQRTLLDTFAKHKKHLAAVSETFQLWRTAQQQLADIITATGDNARHELLRYQVQELTELNLSANELVELEKEHKLLNNAGQIIADCQQVLHTQAETENNLLAQLHHSQQLLLNHKDVSSAISNSEKIINDAIINITEANEQIRNYLQNTNTNPERLNELEQRLTKIYDLARKHHVTANNLFPKFVSLQNELDTIESSGKHIKELEAKIKDLAGSYQAHAAALTTSRKRHATKLARAVSQALQELGMTSAKFNIEFITNDVFSTHGNERIIFLVQTNPGQPAGELNKVASGGELSRISLAIQVITATKDATPTLLFDEVDVGVGGATAEIIGQLLKKLGAKAQVFCVTHLAQVAANGDHHFQVKKITKQGRTYPEVQLLDAEQRTLEIARMLGGVKLTAQTKAHAAEMLAAVHAHSCA